MQLRKVESGLQMGRDVCFNSPSSLLFFSSDLAQIAIFPKDW